MQQRGSNQRDELLEDVPSAQLTQRGRVSHCQRGQEAQRHLRHVHVALRDQRRQLGQDSVYHHWSHRRAEAQDERVRVVDRVELRFGGWGLQVCVCVCYL